MPPLYHHQGSSRTRSLRGSSSHSSWNASPNAPSSLAVPTSAPTSSRSKNKRKSTTPYKSPSPRTEAAPEGGGTSTVINVSQLLRVLAREHASNQLDNQRYKPNSPRAPKGSIGVGSPSPTKETTKRVYRRDVLIPMDSEYGRGKRSSSIISTMRGRSPVPVQEKGKGKPKPIAGTSIMSRSRSQDHPHRPSQYHHLAVPGLTSSMNRSSSLGPAASSSSSAPSTLLPPSTPSSSPSSSLRSETSVLPSTTTMSTTMTTNSISPTESGLVVTNSPLARSFTSNGKGEIEETLVVEGRRSRNPSAGGSGSAYVSPRPSPRTQPASTTLSNQIVAGISYA